MTATTPVRRLPMHPKIGRRRAAVGRARGRRRLRALVGILGVVAFGAIAVAVGHSPLLSARHVTVAGARHTSPALVVRTIGLGSHPPMLDVSPAADEARLDALPWVARAQVARRWPDTVAVRITERVPVAAVAEGGPGDGWVLVDGTGRVLQWQSTAPPDLASLVSPAAPGRPGSTLGPAADPGLEAASALGALAPGTVRSVRVEAGGDVTLGLAGGVEAVLGTADSLGPKLAALRSVLAGAPPTRPEVIDVSVPGEPTVGPLAA